MILTSTQAKAKLGIKTTEKLKRLVAAGAIRPANALAPGKSKYFMTFDSREIDRYLRELRNGPPLPLSPPASAAQPAVSSTAAPPVLARIESKIDALNTAMLETLSAMREILAVWR